jgi:ribosomal protein L37AE/L43A
MYPRDFPTATEHNYDMNEAGHWQCSICGHTVKIKRDGVCIGVPIFKDWDDIPDTMNTKTTLNKTHGLKITKDQKPVGAKKQYNHRGKETGGFYPLYALADAKPKKQPTKAQLAALKKAQHMAEKVYVTCTQCNRPVEGEYDNLSVTRKQYEAKYTDYVCRFCKDKAEAIRWAQSILKTNAYILDTETSDHDGEIIEIAIIDMQGNPILNQRIKPQGDIAQGAYQVHGISLEDLKDCPTF